MKDMRSLVDAILVFAGFLALGCWVAWSSLHS
jgi:hypothetical protein